MPCRVTSLGWIGMQTAVLEAAVSAWDAVHNRLSRYAGAGSGQSSWAVWHLQLANFAVWCQRCSVTVSETIAPLLCIWACNPMATAFGRRCLSIVDRVHAIVPMILPATTSSHRSCAIVLYCIELYVFAETKRIGGIPIAGGSATNASTVL